MKKIILTMGSLAMAATATVGTVLTVASCGETGSVTAKGEYDANSKRLSLNVVADNVWISTITDDFPTMDENGALSGIFPPPFVEKLVELIPNITTEIKSSKTYEEATNVQMFKQASNKPWLNAPVDLTKLGEVAQALLPAYYSAKTATDITTGLASAKNLGDVLKLFNDAKYADSPKISDDNPQVLADAVTSDPINAVSYMLLLVGFTQAKPGDEYHVLPELSKNKAMQVYINDDSMLSTESTVKQLDDLWGDLGSKMISSIDDPSPWASATGISFKGDSPKTLNKLKTTIEGFLNPPVEGGPVFPPTNATTLTGLFDNVDAVLSGSKARTIIETPAAGTLTKSQIDLYKKLSANNPQGKAAFLIYAAQELTKA
ncbi:MAG: hypothetical protein NC236_01045 [Mycoplasma sp.]|nr:hypothetical protein [Mycoplasma sp.]